MIACKDRISSLPDAILQHILSFIPTKYAVGTSVLSKRWKYVWTGIPVLDLSQTQVYPTEFFERNLISFMNFVDRVLLLRDASKITKFHLSWWTTFLNFASSINTWLPSVVRCNVQEIYLEICYCYSGEMERFVLPLYLFNCESLTTLKINANSILKIPDSSICFSSLKVLHLHSIAFTCECSTEHFFFNLPILEELFLNACDWVNIKVVNICAPKMKMLTISDGNDDELSECEIKVYAKSLLSLKIQSLLWQEFSMCNLSSSVNVYIDVDLGRNDLYGDRACKLLREFSNLSEVTLSHDAIKAILLSPHPLPFPNFSKLRVTQSSDLSVDIVEGLFNIFPNLESLLFIDGLTGYDYWKEDWKLSISTQPSMPHLKSVEFWYYSGDETELSIIGFFLKNARVLERMTIISSKVVFADSKTQVEVAKQLLMLPRSSTCIIDFS